MAHICWTCGSDEGTLDGLEEIWYWPDPQAYPFTVGPFCSEDCRDACPTNLDDLLAELFGGGDRALGRSRAGYLCYLSEQGYFNHPTHDHAGVSTPEKGAPRLQETPCSRAGQRQKSVLPHPTTVMPKGSRASP